MKMLVKRGLVLVSWLACFACVLASNVLNAEEVDIEVVALFSNAAVLKVDGKQRLLKSGETSPEGILLEKADSSGVTIRYEGKLTTIGLSERITTQFRTPERRTAAVQVNRKGQYITTGSINGRPVRFLIDTGANILAMSSVSARSLGIDTSTGRRMRGTTASGTIESTEVYLGVVQVGDIVVENVQAVVIDGGYPTEILLGMSFLKNVKIEENAGLMLLTSQF